MSEIIIDDSGMHYATFMAPAVVEAADNLPEYDPNVSAAANMARGRLAVWHSIKDLDWENSGIPDPTFDSSLTEPKEQPKTAQELARTFMDVALDDCSRLFMLYNELVIAGELQISAEHVPILRQSHFGLLRFARLSELDKEALLTAATFPKTAEKHIGVELQGPPLIIKQAVNGQMLVAWNEQLETWIDNMIIDTRGCPALRIAVTNEAGKKERLLYYFWDRVVAANYPAVE